LNCYNNPYTGNIVKTETVSYGGNNNNTTFTSNTYQQNNNSGFGGNFNQVQTNTNFNTGFNTNTNTNFNTNFNTNMNTNYNNNNFNTGYNQVQTNNNFNTGFNQVQTNNNFNTGFNNNNVQVNSNTISSPYGNVTITTSNTSLVDYKQCPKSHYLSLCTRQMRNNARCDLCKKTNLNYTWTCFPCDWDLCTDCYDINNNCPTKSVKVCRKNHLLVYTTQFNRPNVKCDTCGSKYCQAQYTCYICDYDMCTNCYSTYKPKDGCTIF